VARIKWNASGAIRIITRSAREGILDTMQEVFKASQEEVPRDTGYLASTGELRINPKSVSIRYTADYALEQHENLHYRHPHGKAKYLEDPFNRIVPGARASVADKVSRALRRD